MSGQGYSYDAVGNQLSSLGLSPYTHNVSNQLISTPNATFTYDNNGNTTSKTDASGTTTYTWDYENRLTQVTLPGSGGTVSFTYDPMGRRIRKIAPSTTTIYAYDGANIIEETDSSGTAVVRYSQGLNIDEPLAMLRSSTTHFYNADGLGSITSLTDSSGATSATYRYDTFGNLASSTGSVVNPFRYTAREWDAEIGLYYYRARYYDGAAGRFLNEDPIGFDGSINFYPYVDNNPVSWGDPDGLRKVQICCRGLFRFWPFLAFFKHCYIKIVNDDGKVTTYGVLGDPDSSQNQIPRKNDTGGKLGSDRNSKGKCKDVKGQTECKIRRLEEGLERSYESKSCPSCGSNYRFWFPLDLLHFFDGFNSNTYAYNMVLEAGMTPPRFRMAPGYHPAPGPWYPN